MKRLSVLRAYLNVFYWIVLMLIVTVISIIGLNYYSFFLEHWFATLTSIATLFGSLVTLKDISTKFQKFIYKTKVVLRNKQIAYSLDCRYRGEMITASTFNNTKNFLKGLGENNIVISERMSDIAITIDGVVIQCSFRDYDNENIFSPKLKIGEISLFIPEYHAPYVEANVLLEQRILPILHKVKQNFGECEESFTFDVFFKESHPYLGLYLKGIDQENTLSFNCNFKESPSVRGLKEESIISVSKKNLTLNTKNLYSLDRLIQKHLFLSGG